MRTVTAADPITLDELRTLAAADFLEFDSLINLRPSFGNRSRGVDDPETRGRISVLVGRLVRR